MYNITTWHLGREKKQNESLDLLSKIINDAYNECLMQLSHKEHSIDALEINEYDNDPMH